MSYNPEQPFHITNIYNKKNNKNIISYSLYGNNKEKYYSYILDNIKVCNDYLPEWHIRIYLHNKTDKDFLKKLISSNVEIYIVDDKHTFPGNSAGAFWRFLPLCENVNLVILDIDEYLQPKVKLIKDFFNNTKYNFYIEQWYYHNPSHFLAGRIMKKKNVKFPFNKKFIQSYPIRSLFGQDEVFLAKEVYPHINNDKLYRNINNKITNYLYNSLISIKNNKIYLNESFKNLFQ